MTKIKDLSSFLTPILIIAFNRPEKLRILLNTIEQVNPEQVYISIDGRRQNRPEDTELVEECAMIARNWKGEKAHVEKNIEDQNLGCRDHVIKAISWFFQKVESGIILEDDCIPSESFFEYTSLLLDRYQKDERVIMISGNNFGKNHLCSPYSYSFTKYISIWGWATWSDRWSEFLAFYRWLDRANESDLGSLKSTIQSALMNRKEGEERFQYMLNALEKKTDSWGYLLSGFALSTQRSTIIPVVNLISNVGFGTASTHTVNSNSELSEIDRKEMEFPMTHPPYSISSMDYHEQYQPELRQNNSPHSSFLRRLKSKWA